MSKILRVSFIAIGSELLSGQVTDANSAYLAAELSKLGFKTQRISLVDDILSDISREIDTLKLCSDLIFTTGGLGPTSDDCTRQAIAQAASVELEKSEESVARLTAYAEKRRRPMNENSLLQAFFPKGAEVLVNGAGTADAFITAVTSNDKKSVPVISLPGPPRELRHVFENEVKPRLLDRFKLQKTENKYLRCFGLSESFIGTLIDGLKLPDGVSVAYRPTFPELLLTLSLEPECALEAKAEEKLNLAAQQIEDAIGTEFVFSREANVRLANAVATLLKNEGLKLSLAESCTGGMLAEKLVSVAGASEFLLSSLVTYSNSAKEVFLGVKPSLLKAHGAVSEDVAKAMAYGAKNRIGADIAVSITGIAGPDGGSKEKPVGTVWIGLATQGEVQAFHYHIPLERNAVRVYATALALDLLRRKISSYPLIREPR